MEDVKTQGFGVVQGFSGGPVWDTQLQGVVGMVVASVRSTTVDTKAAFVIPFDMLTAIWEIESPVIHVIQADMGEDYSEFTPHGLDDA